MGRRRGSTIRKATILHNLSKSSKYSGADKENEYAEPRGKSSVSVARSSPPYFLTIISLICFQTGIITHQINKLQERGDNFRKQLKVAKNKVTRIQSSKDTLSQKLSEAEGFTRAAEAQTSAAVKSHEEISSKYEDLREQHNKLLRDKERLRSRDNRAEASQRKAVQQATETASQLAHTFPVKDTQGAITNNTRVFVQQLAERGVPVESIPATIEASASHFGLAVQGGISVRTVGRIVLEGGIAAKLQVASELAVADGITISCDGTSHLNTQYESKHVTYTLPGQSAPVTRTLGVSSAPNHTSEEQLNGWLYDLQELCDIMNSLPSRASLPKLTVEDLGSKIKGMGSDHAEDQKKLTKLLRTWKVSADRFLRGKASVALMDIPELSDLLLEESNKLIADAGGEEAWNQLPDEVIDEKRTEAFRVLCTRLGNDAFAQLPRAEQEDVDQWFWGGCCGHKEANAVKYGDGRMRAYWAKAGRQGPIALPNKFNRDSASTSKSSEASAGAVKATSLAGAIFNNKDDKKGQHNTTRQFLEKRLGYQVRFPDTSNTRFQSHCLAAEELLVHLDLYREFMEAVRDGKDKAAFTNIERNVFEALHDEATLTEMAALALYSQSIGHPYMAAVRGQTLAARNLLDLGPLHEKVMSHCHSIIKNPDLLIGAGASYTTGSLDGKQWQRPETMYRVLYLSQREGLPYLRDVLVAFFEGALDGWRKFSAEFDDGGTIASTAADSRVGVFIHATNDLNEGALGALRVALRRRPNMSLHQHNSRAMFKGNGTSEYLEEISPEDQQYIRKSARTLDASRVEKRRRIELAEAHEAQVKAKRAKIHARETKKAVINAKLDALEIRLDLVDIEANPGNVNHILAQLEWHRRHDLECVGNTVLKSKTQIRAMKKPEKVVEWKAAVKRYVEHIPTCKVDLSSPAETVAQDVATANSKEYDHYGEDSDDEL